MEDEFTCPGSLLGALLSLRGSVESIFRASLAIGHHGNDGQIWLKLRGASGNMAAAKLFIRGLVTQEQQQEVSYPGVLHCVFSGARGLFLRCLTRNTSAHILVGSPGTLLISGLTEPVVQAYSLIMDLVDRCHESGSRASDSCRAFKSLVEEWEARYAPELLMLPAAVKETLLAVVEESGLGPGPGQLSGEGTENRGLCSTLMGGAWLGGGSGERWDPSSQTRLSDVVQDPPDASSGVRTTPLGADWGWVQERRMHFPEEVGEEGGVSSEVEEVEEEEEEEEEVEVEEKAGKVEALLSVKSREEFGLLLKFFTAMGYTEGVVRRVLLRTGPGEASQILDLVQQEQDHSDTDRTQKDRRTGEGRNAARGDGQKAEEAGKRGETGGGERTRTLELGPAAPAELRQGDDRRVRKGSRDEGDGEEEEEDFVLCVLKKAAASCGYTEQRVEEVYSMLPDLSTHQLILGLQSEGARGARPPREEPREMDDPLVEWEQPPSRLLASGSGVSLTTIVGPPLLRYPAAPAPATPQATPPAFTSGPGPRPQPGFLPNPKRDPSDPRTRRCTTPRSARPSGSTGWDTVPPGGAARPCVLVTGQQRFLEALQTPFDLRLSDDPGDAGLRVIIIDGSNVAMSHGLGLFFSCRGIALAVQHFWSRGHRRISTFLPQWRQKRDARVKEQHFLWELQQLGLLSYTPSREVQGKRINSYDDRFMLQLAQKTDGVIVTNDNLRDLLDESLAWTNIIKKRLLQFTFVGDLFMVPDDPLGRGGPHLDHFLRSAHWCPNTGGVSSSPFLSSRPSPRSKAEGPHLRDGPTGDGPEQGPTGDGPEQGPTGDGPEQGHTGDGPEPGGRSPEKTSRLREHLLQVFPGQDRTVSRVLQSRPRETDINTLSHLVLGLRT